MPAVRSKPCTAASASVPWLSRPGALQAEIRTFSNHRGQLSFGAWKRVKLHYCNTVRTCVTDLAARSSHSRAPESVSCPSTWHLAATELRGIAVFQGPATARAPAFRDRSIDGDFITWGRTASMIPFRDHHVPCGRKVEACHEGRAACK